MVTLSESDGRHYETICGDCYNVDMADALGIENFKDFEPNLIQKDSDGIEHRFEIRKMIHETGVSWEAIEFLDDDEIGYSFEVHQDFNEASNQAVRQLNEKVKVGLCKKFIKKSLFSGQECLSFNGDTVEGKIQWDDNYDGRIPKFKIDGVDYTAEQVGHMLMAYEGWNFELIMKEATDD
jgi:hypothetical protein